MKNSDSMKTKEMELHLSQHFTAACYLTVSEAANYKSCNECSKIFDKQKENNTGIKTT